MNYTLIFRGITRHFVVTSVWGILFVFSQASFSQESAVAVSTDDSVVDVGSACDATPCNCSSSHEPECWLDGRDSELRQALRSNGITFTNNLTNFYIGNTRGGNEQQFNFAGHGDYLTNFDIHKMGGPQGQFLQIRAEHRYGESITPASGALLPPVLATDIPVRDSEQLYLTNFLFTQALSESFAIYAGKLDTLGGMNDSLTSGRGIDQFSNLSLIGNPLGLRSVGYSSLGTGFAVLQEGEKIFNFLIFNARDTTETDGFSELFADGVVLAPELKIPTNFMGLPGFQSLGGIWSSREFASLNQSPFFLLPEVPIARQSGTWALLYDFDQYLVVDPCNRKRGWGIFGRAGIADNETNPASYFLSAGLAGHSLMSSRPDDRFGAGWFHYGASSEIAPFVQNIVGPIRDGQGVELFYNLALNKRMFITADTQYLQSPLANVDNALLVGLRANLAF